MCWRVHVSALFASIPEYTNVHECLETRIYGLFQLFLYTTGILSVSFSERDGLYSAFFNHDKHYKKNS